MKAAVGLLMGGRYCLSSRIAIGGMGEVWVAEDQALGREVAVKVLREEYAGNEDFLARLRAEARNNASLSHRNIAQMYDYGEQEGAGYLVMELVHGEPMADLLEREPVVPLPKLLPILAQTAHGLSAAHEASVVHRDIKPGNILLDRSGDVKITDFGVSLSANQIPMTATGMVMGTAQYLSPEQATGEAATGASDIYALGIVAYESIAGNRPFTGSTPVDIAVAHVNEQVPPLPAGTDPELAEFIYAMLAKDPAKRPHPALAVAEKFESIARRITHDPWSARQVAPRLHRSRHGLVSGEEALDDHSRPAPSRSGQLDDHSRPAPSRAARGRAERRLAAASTSTPADSEADSAGLRPPPPVTDEGNPDRNGHGDRSGIGAHADVPAPPAFEPWARHASSDDAARAARPLPASRAERRRQAERLSGRTRDSRSFDRTGPFDGTGRGARSFDRTGSFDDTGRINPQGTGAKRTPGTSSGSRFNQDDGSSGRVIELTPSSDRAARPQVPGRERPDGPRRESPSRTQPARQARRRPADRPSAGSSRPRSGTQVGSDTSEYTSAQSTRSRAAQSRAALNRRRTRLARVIAAIILVSAVIVIFFACKAMAVTAEAPSGITSHCTRTTDARLTHPASDKRAASGMIDPSPQTDAPAVRL